MSGAAEPSKAAVDAWLEQLAQCKTRDAAAVVYRRALETTAANASPSPWPVLNAEIMRRWSKSGLRYVKEKAWKLK